MMLLLLLLVGYCAKLLQLRLAVVFAVVFILDDAKVLMI